MFEYFYGYGNNLGLNLDFFQDNKSLKDFQANG